MDTPAYAFFKEQFAPCGLQCGKCFAYSKGDIVALSQQLQQALGGFEAYAKAFAGGLNEPVLEEYPAFKKVLDFLAQSHCDGCRSEACKLFRTCTVHQCSQSKGVDFCFQCSEFPCQTTGFNEHLYKKYLSINETIRQIGLEAYYNTVKDKPRY